MDAVSTVICSGGENQQSETLTSMLTSAGLHAAEWDTMRPSAPAYFPSPRGGTNHDANRDTNHRLTFHLELNLVLRVPCYSK